MTIQEWSTIPLGDLCDIALGKTPARRTAAYWDADKKTDNVWLSIADLPTTDGACPTVDSSKEHLSDEGAALCKLVKAGTLIVSFKLTLGRMAIASRELLTNEAIAALTIGDETQLSRDYLYWYFTYFDWQDAAKNDHKIKGLTLNKKKLKELPVVVPPIPEQRRIVALLDEAFAGLATAQANTRRNLINARELFESTLRQVFEEDPDDWRQHTLEEISSDFGRGRSRHRPRNAPHLYGGEYPFVQTGDIRKADHILSEFSQTYSDDGLAQSKLWPRGTVCITIAANIAETAVLGFDGCIPDSVIGVTTAPLKANPMFVEYLLQASKLSLQAEGKGSAQDNINMGTFQKRTFGFPSVRHQEEVIGLLDATRSAVNLIASNTERKLAAIEELKQSLLHRAFRSELSVDGSPLTPNIAETAGVQGA